METSGQTRTLSAGGVSEKCAREALRGLADDLGGWPELAASFLALEVALERVEEEAVVRNGEPAG